MPPDSPGRALVPGTCRGPPADQLSRRSEAAPPSVWPTQFPPAGTFWSHQDLKAPVVLATDSGRLLSLGGVSTEDKRGGVRPCKLSPTSSAGGRGEGRGPWALGWVRGVRQSLRVQGRLMSSSGYTLEGGGGSSRSDLGIQSSFGFGTVASAQVLSQGKVPRHAWADDQDPRGRETSQHNTELIAGEQV